MAQGNSTVDQTLRFLLVGKTGSGKSSTGNTILVKEAFSVDLSFGSVTYTCTFERGERNGTAIHVMDCPGLFDTNRPEDEVATDVVQAVACMHPGPSAILYVLMLGNRYTEEDSRVYERLKALLDARVTEYMIIIFTCGDALKGKTINDVLRNAPEALRKVLRECDNRYVVFDNKAEDKQPQVDVLFKAVSKLSEKHGGRPYACPKYSAIATKMEEEVARRLWEVEQKELKSKKYVQQLQMQFAYLSLDMLKLTLQEVKKMHDKELKYWQRYEQNLTELKEEIAKLKNPKSSCVIS